MFEILNLTKKEEQSLKNILEQYCIAKRTKSLRPDYEEGYTKGLKYSLIQFIIAKTIFMTEETATQLIDEYYAEWKEHDLLKEVFE